MPLQHTTDKLGPQALAAAMEAQAVRHAVLCPGSRNAPLLVALSRMESVECLSVADERVAAFRALGIAIATGGPVVAVCTSGTALLNFAPAVAEAFYRHVPLIVVSADRPARWIDQDDSQTLRQPGALTAIVKGSYDLPDNLETMADGPWLARRTIADAFAMAASGPQGPVHINMQLDEPLGRADSLPHPLFAGKPILTLQPRPHLDTAAARALGGLLASPRRVLAVGGFHRPDHRLNRALGRLAALPNVAVVAEPGANVRCRGVISRTDALFGAPDLLPEPPQTVVTFGGALVSRLVKDYLRALPPDTEHWHVGLTRCTVDTYRHLTRRIDMDATAFFVQLAAAMQPHRQASPYAAQWQSAAQAAAARADDAIAAAPWSDLSAFAMLTAAVRRPTDLHLSNGTAVRYAAVTGLPPAIHRTEANRGVSGIDGSTSTALGAASATSLPTLLVSGDMSALYDIGALFSGNIPQGFRMAVIDNSGGNIFRWIGTTSRLPELETRFACAAATPWRAIAESLGWDYHEATDRPSMQRSAELFMRPGGRPAMLRIVTDGPLSADTLRQFFKHQKTP